MDTRYKSTNKEFIVGYVGELVGEVAKFGSLIYGVANAVGDDPSTEKIVGAGVVYLLGSAIERIFNAKRVKATIDETANTLEQKFKE